MADNYRDEYVIMVSSGLVPGLYIRREYSMYLAIQDPMHPRSVHHVLYLIDSADQPFYIGEWVEGDTIDATPEGVARWTEGMELLKILAETKLSDKMRDKSFEIDSINDETDALCFGIETKVGCAETFQQLGTNIDEDM